MIDGIYPFPVKELLAYGCAELRLELSLPFALAYFLVSPDNSQDLWIEDIMVGTKSLMPKQFLTPHQFKGMPWDMLCPCTVRLSFSSHSIIHPGTAIRVQVHNLGKETQTARICAFGASQSPVTKKEGSP